MDPARAVSVASAFGYDGGKFEFVEWNVVVYVVGNALKVLNIATGEEYYVWGAHTAITAFTVNARFGLVAYADNSPSPNIYVLSYPQMEPLVTLQGGAELEYADLGFSRDGMRLVSLSGVPDFSVIVWNWERESELVRSSLPPHLAGSKCSFDPRSNDAIVTSGLGNIVFWQIEKSYEYYFLNSTVGGEVEDTDGSVVEVKPTCHVWTADHLVVSATECGRLAAYSPQSGQGIVFDHFVDGTTAAALLLSRGYVVACTTDGAIRWYNLADDFAMDRITHVRDDEGRDVTQLEIVHAAYSPDYTRILVGLRDSSLVCVSVGETDETFEEIGTFHNGAVNAIATFPDSHILVTVGEDAYLRVYNYTSMGAVTSLKINCKSALTSVACSRNDCVVAVGSAGGVVRVYEINEIEPPRLISRVKVHTHSVDFLMFDPSGTVLASGCKDSTEVYLHDVALRDHDRVGAAAVLGYTTVDDTVVAMAWDGEAADPFSSQLFIACRDNVYRIDVPPPNATTEKYQFTRKSDLKKSLLKTDFPVYAVHLTPKTVREDGRQTFYALSHDRSLKCYTMQRDSVDPDLVEDSDITPPEIEVTGHSVRGGHIATSPDGRWMASGAADGKLILRPAFNLASGHIMNRHIPSRGGITAVAFSFDSQYLLCAGADGALFVHLLSYAGWLAVEEKVRAEITAVSNCATVLEDAPDSPDEPTIVALQEKARQDAENAVFEATKQALAAKVTTVASSFHSLLEKNKAAPPDEQLSREEIVIDPTWRDERRREGDERARVVKERIELENLRKEYLREKIKEECWDAMEQPGRTLSALESEMRVDSYPIRVRSEEELRAIARVKLLRRVEEREMKARKAKEAALESARNKEEEAASEASGGGGAAATPNKPGRAALGRMAHPQRRRRASVIALPSPVGDANASGVELSDTESEDDEEAEGYLLYDPFDLYTAQRKKTQIVVLKTMIHDAKVSFNEHFDETLAKKEAVIATIDEKNKQIEGILKELGETRDLKQYTLTPLEQPETILTVNDNEVGVEKFVTPAERERLAKLRAAEEEKLRKEKGDDSGERALRMMMGGRLEDKQVVGMELQLERPAWMNKPESEMTEVELKQLKEFEKKAAEAQEKAEKQRRHLETQLSTLTQSVQQDVERFDELVRRLFMRRLETDQVISEDELKIIKYSQTLLTEEKGVATEKELYAQYETLNEEYEKVALESVELVREVESRREAYEQVHAEERRLDKDFRRLMLEPGFDVFKDQLMRIWRPRKKQASNEPDEVDDDTADPFAEFDNEILPPLPSDSEKLSDADRPEGMDPISWERVVDSHSIRLQVEAEREARHSVYVDMRAYRDKVMEKKNDLQARLEALIHELTSFHERRKMQAMDLEILLKLKQGYIEVGDQGVLSSQDDIVLIDIKEVEKHNAAIRQLGEDKLALLKEISAVRKQNHFLEWENRKLKLQADEIADLVRAFQLLRVTKNLQELIKGGVGGISNQDRRKAEIATLERQLSEARKSHALKLEDKKRALKKAKRLVADKDMENEELNEQLFELQTSVTEREAIHEVQQRRASGPEKRLKTIAKRRKLVEVAKAHAEEIAMLREEVERLSRKTFPSFRQQV